MLIAVIAIGAVALLLLLRSKASGAADKKIKSPFGDMLESDEPEPELPTFAEPIRGTATGNFTGSLADAKFRDPATIRTTSTRTTVPPPVTSGTVTTSTRKMPGPVAR